jgi:hypothetical protein
LTSGHGAKIRCQRQRSRYSLIVVGLGVPIGYARCSNDAQELTAQQQRLREPGVSALGRVHGAHRSRRTSLQT